MNPKKAGILFKLLYFSFFVVAAIYTNSVLSTDMVDVIKKEDQVTVREIKDITVSLNSTDYNMKNYHRVLDLLQTARDRGNIIFERTDYSDKIVLSSGNAESTLYYKVFLDGYDITNQIKELEIKDGESYKLLVSE